MNGANVILFRPTVSRLFGVQSSIQTDYAGQSHYRGL